MADEHPAISSRTVLTILIGSLVVWAAYVAVGAYLYNFDLVRAIIVLVFMAMFVGIWLLLLWSQGRNKEP